MNFGVLGSLRLWGWGGWVDGGGGGAGWMGVGGGWGVPPTHVHTHAHARTCMHGKHDNSMQMAVPIGFGEIPGIPYDVIRACACVHAHACARVRGDPVTTPHPILPPPHPPGWGTPGISQNSIALELIEIFQFCLKI